MPFVFFQLHCCGVVGPNDYPQSLHDHLPASCCKQKQNNSTEKCTTETALNGCKPEFDEFIKKHLVLIAVFAIIFGIIEVYIQCCLFSKTFNFIIISPFFFTDRRPRFFICIVYKSTLGIYFCLVIISSHKYESTVQKNNVNFIPSFLSLLLKFEFDSLMWIFIFSFANVFLTRF